ncbi:MAG TPA: DUF3006 domain-containing protein [Candidatus Scatovivens faecipullorum]|nr:DUF3006 domain-containing protein [Candidatus Scatovivens faecipullorum]
MDLEFFENKKNVLNNDFSKELEKSILKSNISYSIDRFEGEYAICENRETKEFINIKKDLLPKNCKSGDIITLKNGEYVLDVETTQKEKDEIKHLVDNLFKKKK